MSGSLGAGYRLMIVDDDEMVREVLALLAGRAGFVVEVHSSGAAALERLAARDGGEVPQGVIADVQMPGPAGEAFARQARAMCGMGTCLLAMSATPVAKDELRGYDGFLRKPFSMEALCAALECEGDLATTREDESAEVLRSTTLAEISDAMEPEQLRELYRVFLADAEVRWTALRAAAESRDGDAWRQAAHQLKGSCGMVGAAELARLAGEWEAGGLPGVGEEAPFAEVEAAMARFRHVLAARLP